MTFRSTRDIDKWLCKPKNTVRALRQNLEEGEWDGDDEHWVREWLRENSVADSVEKKMPGLSVRTKLAQWLKKLGAPFLMLS